MLWKLVCDGNSRYGHKSWFYQPSRHPLRPAPPHPSKPGPPCRPALPLCSRLRASGPQLPLHLALLREDSVVICQQCTRFLARLWQRLQVNLHSWLVFFFNRDQHTSAIPLPRADVIVSMHGFCTHKRRKASKHLRVSTGMDAHSVSGAHRNQTERGTVGVAGANCDQQGARRRRQFAPGWGGSHVHVSRRPGSAWQNRELALGAQGAERVAHPTSCSGRIW